MAVSDALRQCLRDLSTHCESLMTENERLRSQNLGQESRANAWVTSPGYVQAPSLVQAPSVVEKKIFEDKPNIFREDTLNDPGVDSLCSLHLFSSKKSSDVEEGAAKNATKKKNAPATIAEQCSRSFHVKKSAPVLSRIETHAVLANQLTFAADATTPESGGKVDEGETLAGMKLNMLTAGPKRRVSLQAYARVSRGGQIDWHGIRQSLCPHHAWRDEEGVLAITRVFESLVNSIFFRSLCLLMIAANTVYIGISADHQVKNSFRPVIGLEKEPEWKSPEIVFAVWFSVELLLRSSQGAKIFFCGVDQRWNIFDAVLVLNSITELAFPGISTNFSFLRIFRVFRVVRFVRVVRTVKALKSLRTMVFALMNSFVSLMWSFAMIGIIIFVFAIIFDTATSSYFDGIDVTSQDSVTEAQLVNASFGTLFETMVSLFCAITGGNDWFFYGDLLRKVDGGSNFYFLLFAFYIGFCLVGMLNVVTGIFVDSAVCTRTEDEVVQGWEDEQQRTSEKVKSIFMEADTDSTGTLSLQELCAKLENPWVKAYFSGLDIDPSEARIIYTLMDTNGDESVSIDEFVNGTMKLKGQAKSIDIMALMFDQARFGVKFNKLCTYLEDQLYKIQEMNLTQMEAHEITPSSPVVFKQVSDVEQSAIDSQGLAAQMNFINKRDALSATDQEQAPFTLPVSEERGLAGRLLDIVTPVLEPVPPISFTKESIHQSWLEGNSGTNGQTASFLRDEGSTSQLDRLGSSGPANGSPEVRRPSLGGRPGSSATDSTPPLIVSPKRPDAQPAPINLVKDVPGHKSSKTKGSGEGRPQRTSVVTSGGPAEPYSVVPSSREAPSDFYL